MLVNTNIVNSIEGKKQFVKGQKLKSTHTSGSAKRSGIVKGRGLHLRCEGSVPRFFLNLWAAGLQESDIGSKGERKKRWQLEKGMDRESFPYDGSVEEVPSSNGWLNPIPVVKAPILVSTALR